MRYTELHRFLYNIPPKLVRLFLPYLKHIRTYNKYRKYNQVHRAFSHYNAGEKKKWIFRRVKEIAIHAQNSNPFYCELYHSANFKAETLQSFDDLSHIPIVTKSMLKMNIEKWLVSSNGYSISNTGGTSGNPLKFLISPNQGARERYYMNQIWAQIKVSPFDYRAVFRGVNLGDNAWLYKPEEDAFFINPFVSFDSVYEQYIKLFKNYRISVLHGYPSSLYLFASYCLQDEYTKLRNLINRNIKGILLGSEFPARAYRSVIEQAFPAPTISWYGHSEKVVLAREVQQHYLYYPFQSYGYTEAVISSSGETHLVGSCYDNFASPFIRYDTEDSITPVDTQHGLLLSFKIDNGRLGEFVVDRNGKHISLTALIFGRHHKAFEVVDFVQVSQPKPGEAIIHVTLSDNSISNAKILSFFDFTNISMHFSVCTRNAPIKTVSGKIPLLVRL